MGIPSQDTNEQDPYDDSPHFNDSSVDYFGPWATGRRCWSRRSEEYKFGDGVTEENVNAKVFPNMCSTDNSQSYETAEENSPIVPAVGERVEKFCPADNAY